MGENGFEIKDSGARKQFDSGMVRDTDENKTLWHLIADGPMFKRWAEHLTKGARKYVARNWMKASGEAELDRFKESAFRHFMQWYRGDRDEDHAAAVFFNINGTEYVREKLTLTVPKIKHAADELRAIQTPKPIYGCPCTLCKSRLGEGK